MSVTTYGFKEGEVQPREPMLGRLELPHRPRPGHGHVDVERAGEGRLLGQEVHECAEAGSEQVLGAGVIWCLLGRGDHPVGQEQAALPGRGQEAVLLVGEMRVERGP